MRQVWAKASISRCSRYGVAVDTRSAFESTPAGAHACVLNRRLLLRAYPRGKIPGTIHKDAQKHLGMLCPAVLCALAEKDSYTLRVHPHPVRVVRNKICLACQLRDPETVVGVGGKQLQKRGGRIRRITHRNVQFVCCHDAQLRRSEEHTSELQSLRHLVCRLLLEKKK